MKTSPAIASILFSFAFVIGWSQTANGQPPIDGLFGIKLGEPLPPACTNSTYCFSAKRNEWGFKSLFFIVPPKTNSAFASYSAELTPKRLVCEVSGSRHSPFPDDSANLEAFNSLLVALRDRYGKENMAETNYLGDFETHVWVDGSRELELRYDHDIHLRDLKLTCTDKKLFVHLPPHVADTNGL
jgi:hypothetical protein